MCLMLAMLAAPLPAAEPAKPTKAELLSQILESTKPLEHPRGERLPLLAWIALDLPGDDAEVERLLRELDARGIGAMTSWAGNKDPKALEKALRIARIQQKLGLDVNIFAALFGMGGVIYNGDPKTAHIDADGQPFFDTSQIVWVKAGCPFAIEHRIEDLTAQVEFFCKGFKDAGIDVKLIIADWEIDGPLETNDGWAAAKKCRVCREKIPDIDTNFEAFQKICRTIRGDMQKRVYADTMKKYFPGVLVGNYGVYPNDGWRYWYDFYEKVPTDEAIPTKRDGRAKFRKWFPEWELTGYTYAQPVVYPRYEMHGWYDFENIDYRWFRGLLLNASNGPQQMHQRRLAGEDSGPTISFIKYHTTDKPDPKLPDVPNISEAAYKELLWHMLLRGTDGLINWCPDPESPVEVRLLQEVYRESAAYNEFFLKGEPIAFDTPERAGPVVSGMKLGQRVLVRRTDFGADDGPVKVRVGGVEIEVPKREGCQIIELASQ
jgi:hypothetical protein